MKDKMTLSRRGFLNAVAALGSIGLIGCGTRTMTQAAVGARDRAAATLPNRGEFVVRGAQILTMDPALGDLTGGDIHVRAGEIVAVGKDLRLSSGENIDGRGMIALPGLIDAHSHLWNTPLRNLVDEGPKMGYFALTLALGKEYTPEDMYRGVRLAAAEMLYSGITTVHDWSHNVRGPAYADADIRALRDTGIRARFSYGTPQGGLPADQTMDLTDLARVQREWFTWAERPPADPRHGCPQSQRFAARGGDDAHASPRLGRRTQTRAADYDSYWRSGARRVAGTRRNARPGCPADQSHRPTTRPISRVLLNLEPMFA